MTQEQTGLMRFLIIYAHPSPSSFVGALFRRVIEIVRERGHDVDELDLYAEKFDPVMSRRTYQNYLDTTANREEVAPYVKRLLAAEALVLVHPVWHDGIPAILKGFIDRVFLPGVIFEIDENGLFQPRLQNIRRLVAVATYGASRRRTSYVGDLPRRFFLRNLGTLIAPGASVEYLADYGLDTATPAQRARFSARVSRACRAW